MPLDHPALALIGLLVAAWTIAAGVAIIVAQVRDRRAATVRLASRRLNRILEESPAIPLLVRVDGRIEAPQRLAHWLGLEKIPQFLTELAEEGRGLLPEQLTELTEAVRRTQRTAAPFRLVLTPHGSRRSLALRGHLADPQVAPGGAAFIWVFDFSDSESELMQLRKEAARANKDFSALVALIEAAPLPMWFRSPDGHMRLVNSAFVEAVGAGSAEEVTGEGIELIETVDGESPIQVAVRAAETGRPIERQVMVTINGQRRAFRVKDLPLRDEGVAGYAIDIEEREAIVRSFDAFRRAQRSMLDRLSAGFAQFGADRRLIFANRSFQSMFALEHSNLWGRSEFGNLLSQASEAGRTPVTRDFSQWRRERERWFEATEVIDEPWPLPDGTHLRVVAEPVPDGGLLLIVEDRTEQLRLSALGDTLLRSRAATFDSLFESVAAFAPNGRLQLWNRRFVSDWGLDSEFLDTHPHIEVLLGTIAQRLEQPENVSALGDAVRLATLDRITMGGRLALADGRTLEYAGVPLPDGNGLLTVIDVTDTQKAEHTLRERNAGLQEAEVIRARILTELGHELRMPLNVIGGFAERLQAGIGGTLNETGGDYVDAILTSVDRISENVERLFDLSRFDRELSVPSLETAETIELLPLATRLVEARRARIDAAGLSLDLRGGDGGEDEGGGSVTGDEPTLRLAIGNLLDHAIASTPPGGRILFELTRQHGHGRDWARIVVSDNGCGMDDAALSRALAGGPGFVAAGEMALGDAAAAADDPARGLALARDIIEAHGGALELLSEPGQGTAAIVELP